MDHLITDEIGRKPVEWTAVDLAAGGAAQPITCRPKATTAIVVNGLELIIRDIDRRRHALEKLDNRVFERVTTFSLAPVEHVDRRYLETTEVLAELGNMSVDNVRASRCLFDETRWLPVPVIETAVGEPCALTPPLLGVNTPSGQNILETMGGNLLDRLPVGGDRLSPRPRDRALPEMLVGLTLCRAHRPRSGGCAA